MLKLKTIPLFKKRNYRKKSYYNKKVEIFI